RARVPSCRQGDFEARARSRRVARADRAAVPLDDGANDRQAETAARRLMGAGPRHIRLVKPIEHAAEMFFWNPGSAVLDDQMHPIARLLSRHGNSSAIGGMAERVRHQVLQRLLEPLGVAAYREAVRMGGGLERDLFLLQHLVVPISQALEQL